MRNPFKLFSSVAVSALAAVTTKVDTYNPVAFRQGIGAAMALILSNNEAPQIKMFPRVKQAISHFDTLDNVDPDQLEIEVLQALDALRQNKTLAEARLLELVTRAGRSRFSGWDFNTVEDAPHIIIAVAQDVANSYGKSWSPQTQAAVRKITSAVTGDHSKTRRS